MEAWADQWLLPSLSQVFAQPSGDRWPVAETQHRVCQIQRRVKAEREWCGAIAALNGILRPPVSPSPNLPLSPGQITYQGVILSGPGPVLEDGSTIAQFSNWVFQPQPKAGFLAMPLQLPPTARWQVVPENHTNILPLLENDPLTTEQFCLVFSQHFSLLMVLGEDVNGDPAFQWTFEPNHVDLAYQMLRPRILMGAMHQFPALDRWVQQFPSQEPDYRLVTRFSQLILHHLPDQPVPTRIDDCPDPIGPVSAPRDESPQDVELLQAMAHEIRTPLTTIRTLTRSLLRRRDLIPEVTQRLEMIDRECSTQIDRFGLIFQAVELETAPPRSANMPLTATSLAQMLQQSIPRWQKQASQCDLSLDVVLPQKMPKVVSNPALLDQVLTSLIERLTHSLPTGSHIQLKVMLAGEQLKLQFRSQPDPAHEQSTAESGAGKTHLKSVGQLLMFQPETGNLSLNLAVTKNLFQSMGGKLIVRQKPQGSETLTVFLPLELNAAEIYNL